MQNKPNATRKPSARRASKRPTKPEAEAVNAEAVNAAPEAATEAPEAEAATNAPTDAPEATSKPETAEAATPDTSKSDARAKRQAITGEAIKQAIRVYGGPSPSLRRSASYCSNREYFLRVTGNAEAVQAEFKKAIRPGKQLGERDYGAILAAYYNATNGGTTDPETVNPSDISLDRSIADRLGAHGMLTASDDSGEYVFRLTEAGVSLARNLAGKHA